MSAILEHPEVHHEEGCDMGLLDLIKKRSIRGTQPSVGRYVDLDERSSASLGRCYRCGCCRRGGMRVQRSLGELALAQ